MVELRDIIDLIYVLNNNSIYIIDGGSCLDKFDDDISSVLPKTVDSIDIYGDRVEIYVKESFEPNTTDLLNEVLYED